MCFICLALLKNVLGSKIPFAFLVCTSFVLEFVASFLENKTEELTKRLPKHYELVRIGLRLSDNLIIPSPLMGEG